MGLSSVNLRHKIASASDLKGVVRTMKSLAASNIHQYEASAIALKDYVRALELGLSLTLQQTLASTPSVVKQNAETKQQGLPIQAIVFGSDQGLVGQFNEDISNFAVATLNRFDAPINIWAVGEQVYSRLSDTGISMGKCWMLPSSVNAISNLISLIQIKMDEHSSASNAPSEQRLYVFHNRISSKNLFKPTFERLLPLDHAWQKQFVDIQWPSKMLAEVLGDNALTLRALIREYMFISLYRACAESQACENACRLTAMQRAEKNIEELLETLASQFNNLRQSAIDEELSDVLAGYELLIH